MTKSNQQVHTSEAGAQGWSFEVPPLNLRSSKMQLLTIGRVSVVGHWTGGLGQHFVGWAPLLKVPKDANIPPTVYNGPKK